MGVEGGVGKSFCHQIHIFVFTVIMDKLEDDCQISEEVILPGGGLAAISIPFKQLWGFLQLKKKKLMWTIFTVSIECVTILLLLDGFSIYLLLFFGHKSCGILSP